MQHAREAAGIIRMPGNEQNPGSHFLRAPFDEASLILPPE
jgi:hypothetical protein